MCIGDWMKMKLFISVVFLAVFLAGCLSPPKPLNETGLMGLNNSIQTPPPAPQSKLLNTSFVCVISEGPLNTTTYIQGTNVRYETPISGTNETQILISKGNTMYMKSMGDQQSGAPFENCTWLIFTGKNIESNAAIFEIASEELSKMPNCKPTTIDAAMFEITGKVCDMNKIIQQEAKNFNCSTLTDPEEKTACEAYMASIQ